MINVLKGLVIALALQKSFNESMGKELVRLSTTEVSSDAMGMFLSSPKFCILL